MEITQLNARYGLAEQLQFVQAKGGFINLEIRNVHAQAQISLYGGQVLAFCPQGEETDLLFVSDNAYFQYGKAIKGGIPVCWPWFGNDPEGLGRAAHGFARNRTWDVITTASLSNGATQVVLGLQDDAETRALWPYAFQLRLTITIAESLSLQLTTHNTGTQTFKLTQALHSYFQIGDVQYTALHGLDGCHYVDNSVQGQGAIRQQDGDVVISEEVDRIYLQVPAALQLDAPALARRVTIHTQGSQSVVVWNPWQAIAAKMGDLDAADYQHFLCVETANVAEDVIDVAAGEQHSLAVEYCLHSV